MPTRVLHKQWWQAISATKAAVLASVAVFLAFAAIAYVAYSSRKNQNNNCIASLRVRDAVVVLLEDAQNTVEHTKAGPTISQKQIDDAKAFYRRNIVKIKNVQCNKGKPST
jgi:hypothetical protein